MKNNWLSRILLVCVGFGIIALCIISAVATHLVSNIEGMEIRKLKDTSVMVDKMLFKANTYLVPDTAYFSKLEEYLLTGRITSGDALETTVSAIRKNLSKGAGYDSNIHSVYTVLEDENAPYILVNGKLSIKNNMRDQDWIDICRSMGSDCYAGWREIDSSYLNQVDLFTVYRKYDSSDYVNNRVISGYMVINYYHSHIVGKILTFIGSEEAIVLYNPADDSFLFIGKEYVSEEELRESLSHQKDGCLELTDGVMNTENNGKLIYSICESDYAPIYYIMIKENVEVNRFMSEIYLIFLIIMAVFSAVIILFIILYSYQHRKYLTGLVQVITAVGQDESMEENAMKKLAFHMKAPENDLTIIAKKILDDNMDINELKMVLGLEQRLRMEIEMLYGHAQINSHFLLNSLDSIYWESVKSNGSENVQTRMIEMLCSILKYALDSSDPYISLAEEVSCAKDYLAIQRMRKNICFETEWGIPDELLMAKVGKLILQPILENSIQHGQFDHKVHAIRLRIEAKQMDDVLYLSVIDNGQGMEEDEMRKLNQIFREETPVRSKHIGLLNVNRRIQLQYGEEYGIVLQPVKEGGGLMVVIRLKYIKMESV